MRITRDDDYIQDDYDNCHAATRLPLFRRQRSAKRSKLKYLRITHFHTSKCHRERQDIYTQQTILSFPLEQAKREKGGKTKEE